MGRLFLFTGFLLQLVVVGLFLSMVTDFTAGTVIITTLVESQVCEDNETLWLRDDDRFVCTNEQYEDRLVTEETMLYLLGGGIGGLILGIILVNMGSGMQRREQETQIPSPYAMQSGFSEVYQDGVQVDVNQMDLENISARIPPEAQAILRHVIGQIGGALDGETLSERLQQLEDARQQGLISQAEYDRVRQAILDSMDD